MLDPKTPETHDEKVCEKRYMPDTEDGIALHKAVARLLLQREGVAPAEWGEMAARLHPYSMNPRECRSFHGHLEATVAVLHEIQGKPGWKRALESLVRLP